MLNISREIENIKKDIKNIESDRIIGKINDEEFLELLENIEYRYCHIFIAQYELKRAIKKSGVVEA